MEVMLVLSAFFCVGLSYQHRNYGETFEMSMLSHALKIRFTPANDFPPAILWRRSDYPLDYGRRKMKDNHFVITSLTQEDSGTYEQLDYRSRAISTKKLLVKEITRYFTRGTGESLEVTYYLEEWSCNIVFVPEDNRGSNGFEIIQRGNAVKQNSKCLGFVSAIPCGFANEKLQMTCRGRYEFKDSKGNLAMVAFLQMKNTEYPIVTVIIDLLGNIMLGLAFISASCCCCGCIKHCCCGEDTDDKDESPEDEAETEPANPPEIHSPRPEIPPPVFSKMSVPAKKEDAPIGPVSTDSDSLIPQFELKGIDFDSGDGVYNSDKLNFL